MKPFIVYVGPKRKRRHPVSILGFYRSLWRAVRDARAVNARGGRLAAFVAKT